MAGPSKGVFRYRRSKTRHQTFRGNFVDPEMHPECRPPQKSNFVSPPAEPGLTLEKLRDQAWYEAGSSGRYRPGGRCRRRHGGPRAGRVMEHGPTQRAGGPETGCGRPAAPGFNVQRKTALSSPLARQRRGGAPLPLSGIAMDVRRIRPD